MVKPKVRNNMCMNVDPEGLTKPVVEQIEFVKQSMADAKGGPKRVLVLGGSGGYGLASRIAATFGYGADTIGISFEREPSERRDGTPGWYNNEIFDKLATEAGHKAISLNADAFANATRETVAELIRTELGQVDLVVYSLAAPVRPDPETGELYRSAIKPITEPYDAVTVDVMTGDMKPINIPVATEEEVSSTIKVMGGEDWALWTDYLLEQGLLAEGATTVAYSYIGPEITRLIYRSGALGKAKQHLEGTAAALSEKLSVLGGRAYVSVNKALVTRASAVIPTMPVYIAALYKVMKAKGVHNWIRASILCGIETSEKIISVEQRPHLLNLCHRYFFRIDSICATKISPAAQAVQPFRVVGDLHIPIRVEARILTGFTTKRLVEIASVFGHFNGGFGRKAADDRTR